MLGLAPTSAKATGSARTSEFGLAPRDSHGRDKAYRNHSLALFV